MSSLIAIKVRLFHRAWLEARFGVVRQFLTDFINLKFMDPTFWRLENFQWKRNLN